MINYSKILLSILLVVSSCQISASSMKEVIEPVGSQNIAAREALVDFVFQEPLWQRFKKRINNAWINFKRRNIPSPKLIDHQDLILDNKKMRDVSV